MNNQLKIKVFPEVLGICRLGSSEAIPCWAEGAFLSVTRTSDELTIVCREKSIPETVKHEKGWRYFRIDQVLDFSMVGVLSSISGVLARRDISIFVVSTYDTDYFLVKEQALAKAVAALKQADYHVQVIYPERWGLFCRQAVKK